MVWFRPSLPLYSGSNSLPTRSTGTTAKIIGLLSYSNIFIMHELESEKFICDVRAYFYILHSPLYLIMQHSVSWRFKTWLTTVYPKKYAHGFCFAVLCCGYTLTDIPKSIRLTSLALWQSNNCPSASKATLMNMDKYFMWIHYERLQNRLHISWDILYIAFFTR